jgi:hypothetical protein
MTSPAVDKIGTRGIESFLANAHVCILAVNPSSSSAFGTIRSTFPARVIQVAMKLVFQPVHSAAIRRANE